jgi:hypothetical protein
MALRVLRERTQKRERMDQLTWLFAEMLPSSSGSYKLDRSNKCNVVMVLHR